MTIKKYNPTSAGLRHAAIQTDVDVTRKSPEKRLVKRIKKNSGRNHTGQITVRHRGGGAKKMYRMVDFKQLEKLNIEGKVSTIEYDPIRTANIMLVVYVDGDKRYHLAPQGIKVGDKIETKVKGKVRDGNRMMLKHIPVGYPIHNIEMTPGQGGKLVRVAGGQATLISLESKLAQLKMPSNEIRLLQKECYATIGSLGNADHSNEKMGKAGRRRWMGWRPSVRGKAMNAVDHPHGGGKGVQPIGLKHPKTPWGICAIGFKTRKRNYTDKYILKDRRNG